MVLNLWKARTERRTRAEALYRRIVGQTRRPEFYEKGGVADTFEGRFDLLVAHLALVLYRLKGGGPRERALAQTMFDLFFADMDAALREMGVGDAGVGKRIRRMSEAFYGRLEAYDAGLAAEDAGQLREAVARNLYGGNPPSPAHAAAMADYMRECVQGTQPPGSGEPVEDALFSGLPAFADAASAGA